MHQYKNVYVFSFDFNLYDTHSLLKDLLDRATLFGIPPEQYVHAYRIWSDKVHDSSYLATLDPEKRRSMVSVLEGFVPHLARSIGVLEHRIPTAEKMIREFHETGLSLSRLYPGATEMLERIPKTQRYVITSGGDIDQEAKFHATGLDELILPWHRKVVSSKTSETFQKLYKTWNIEQGDHVIHVNNHRDELQNAVAIHWKTTSILSEWSIPRWHHENRYLPGVIITPTIEECTQLIDGMHTMTERQYTHSRSKEL